jgi:hypothetical protein
MSRNLSFRKVEIPATIAADLDVFPVGEGHQGAQRHTKMTSSANPLSDYRHPFLAAGQESVEVPEDRFRNSGAQLRHLCLFAGLTASELQGLQG